MCARLLVVILQKEMGMSVAELRRVQGIAVDDEDDESDADLKAEGDTKDDAAASDDDEESVRPQRRATRSKRVKDDESEGFEPSVHDDDEAEEEEEVEEQDNDDDDEEEEGYRGRSGRTIRKPVTFAEEQGRELTRRVTRNRRDSSGDERASPNERVQISYERPVHKSEQLRLADGRVVSERELRAMQRHGEQVRVLQEGEEPDAHDAESSGMAQAAAAAAAHPGDVRRSSRPRQQVQHYTVGEKAQHSDDSADDHKPRYPPRQQSGGRARGGPNKGRRPGRPRQSVCTHTHTERQWAECVAGIAISISCAALFAIHLILLFASARVPSVVAPLSTATRRPCLRRPPIRPSPTRAKSTDVAITRIAMPFSHCICRFSTRCARWRTKRRRWQAELWDRCLEVRGVRAQAPVRVARAKTVVWPTSIRSRWTRRPIGAASAVWTRTCTRSRRWWYCRCSIPSCFTTSICSHQRECCSSDHPELVCFSLTQRHANPHHSHPHFQPLTSSSVRSLV